MGPYLETFSEDKKKNQLKSGDEIILPLVGAETPTAVSLRETGGWGLLGEIRTGRGGGSTSAPDTVSLSLHPCKQSSSHLRSKEHMCENKEKNIEARSHMIPETFRQLQGLQNLPELTHF